jgi:Fe-S-cluster formation regulator IscX/YfhJ
LVELSNELEELSERLNDADPNSTEALELSDAIAQIKVAMGELENQMVDEDLNELRERLNDVDPNSAEAQDLRDGIADIEEAMDEVLDPTEIEDLDEFNPQEAEVVEDSGDSDTDQPKKNEPVDSKESNDSKDTDDTDNGDSTLKETADSLNQPLKYLDESKLDNNNLIYNSNEWFNKFLNNLLE